jgi:hypothetical protein
MVRKEELEKQLSEAVAPLATKADIERQFDQLKAQLPPPQAFMEVHNQIGGLLRLCSHIPVQ